MDYNTHMHHNTSPPDQKPVFLHDPHTQQRTHLQSNFQHRGLHHDLPVPPASMDVKLVETPNNRGPPSRGHSFEFENNQNQSMEGSSYVENSPCPCPVSPGSSPAPVSAAAEYLRHQELNRGQPRKRIYQDWNQVAIFSTPSEAEEGIRDFENCRWKVGNKFTSREGFKVYWSCREGASCPVQIHLLYHSQLPRVVLFRNQPSHHHTEKIKTRGLLPEVESLIRDLFNNGVNKPRRIQFILQKKGMEEVPQTKLSNFLVKLRREASLLGNTVVKREKREYFKEEFDEEDDAGHGPYSNSNDEKSNNTLSPSAMFPSVILSTPADHHHQNSNPIALGPPYHHGQGHQMSHSYGNGPLHHFGGHPRYLSPGYQHTQGSENGDNSTYSPSNRLPSSVFSGRSLSSAAVAPKDGDGDQSEVVTCSSSRTQSFYCRDESTQDGEQCLPDEENIKDLLINHIRASYSNRDMLHIRQELKMLKRENKYTALSRLLAFTAGFLQDTFLEKRVESPGVEGDS